MTRFQLHLVLALVAMLFLCWLSSGTMAPYAATTPDPFSPAPCNYLFNGDYGHFRATFDFVDGAPKSKWDWSIYLRRILYPLLAYPWMRAFGYEIGGFVFNLVLQVLTLLGLAYFVRRRRGEEETIPLLWLFATNLTTFYWVGQPFNHASIIPASTAATLLLWKAQETSRPWILATLALGIGIAGTAYDLLPIFAPAMFGLILWRRELPIRTRLWAVGLSSIALLAPTILVAHGLRYFAHVSYFNSNSIVYKQVMAAYFHPGDLRLWAKDLLTAPLVLVDNFFCSQMLVIPVLAVGGWMAARRRKVHGHLEPFEGAILLAGLFLWAINNLAPPYSGWQMRGIWIPRLYQPIGIAVMIAATRFARQISNKWLTSVAVISALVPISALFDARLANGVYWTFYKHTSEFPMERNLQKFGRRPLGFCGK